MTRLSDTQLVILTAAVQRDDRNVLPLPGSLRGGAAAKVVSALLSRGLIEERVTDSTVKADSALNTFWRNEADGRVVLLRIAEAGLAAIGVDPNEEAGDAHSAPEAAREAFSEPTATDTRPPRKPPPPRARGRARGRSRRS